MLGIERTASGYGAKISGETYTPSGKALPSTARKPALGRSNSSPAVTRGPTSKTPIGAKKALPSTATKQITSGVSSAKSGGASPAGGRNVQKSAGGLTKGVGSTVGGVQKTVGSTVGDVSKGVKSTVGGVSKGTVGGVSKGLGDTVGNLSKGVGNTATTATKRAPKALPKPYPQTSKPGSGLNAAKGTTESKATNLPKPYPNSSSFPQSAYPTEKKTAVKPGRPKEFNVNAAKNADSEKKPYPGTNTYPGAGSKSPVRNKTYKPMERMKPPADYGKATHIPV